MYEDILGKDEPITIYCPYVSLQIVKMKIVPRRRKLKVVWKVDSQQELEQFYGTKK